MVAEVRKRKVCEVSQREGVSFCGAGRMSSFRIGDHPGIARLQDAAVS